MFPRTKITCFLEEKSHISQNKSHVSQNKNCNFLGKKSQVTQEKSRGLPRKKVAGFIGKKSQVTKEKIRRFHRKKVVDYSGKKSQVIVICLYAQLYEKKLYVSMSKTSSILPRVCNFYGDQAHDNHLPLRIMGLNL